jgi:glycerol-3-phosphate dehydrogenase (NAD(P)+)
MTERRPLQTIGVVGAGAWGSALANVAARAGRAVRLWARDPSHVEEMIAARENARRLPGVPLESAICPTADMSELAQADAILLVAPAQALRVVTVALAEVVGPDTPLVICAKGFERASGAFLSAVVNEAAPGRPAAALSGPSFADDVARGLPTAVTIAAEDEALAQALCTALSSPAFRLYHSTDLRGVEIGGAAKNVLAIACGAAAGLGLGASAQAALVARGFSELRRFGRRYQARLTRDRLSGQRGEIGLNRVTGKLAGAISSFVIGSSLDDMVLQITFGTPYAIVHELGGTWTFQVPAHQVREHARGTSTVSAHTRQAHVRVAEYKPRLGAQETLRLMIPEFQAAIASAVASALEVE